MRTILLTALILGLAAAGFAGIPWESPTDWHNFRSNSLDDTIVFEGFNDTPLGALPLAWSQVSLDTGSNSDILHGPTVWQAFSRVGFPTYEGTKIVAITYNTNGSPNDDWLVFHAPALGAPISYGFWASAQDRNLPEPFEVWLSTTGNQPGDFSDSLYASSGTPRTWTHYSWDLSAYAGAPFYVAIRYTGHDLYMLKIDAVTLIGHPLGVSRDGNGEVADRLTFQGNYPNPFNSTTDFRFSLPREGKANLVLFNILGQEVAQIINGTLEAGEHSVPFDAAGLESGLYFARLSANGQSSTRKVVLLK